MNTNFDLTPEQRKQLFEDLATELEHYYQFTDHERVAPELDLDQIIDAVRKYDLRNPMEGKEALSAVLEGLRKYAVHTPHPMYYGLFNPRANFAGILADLITAVMNPQLAAWSHSPYANEVEKYLVETFGELFGYPAHGVDGVFASGGAEANFTAILCALNHRFPDVASKGLQGTGEQPLVYCSGETHHSVARGARLAGLGSDSVRTVGVDRHQRMVPDQLQRMIREDIRAGYTPFMAVATAGSTGTGSIDDLGQIGQVCREHGIWYHVDAAYGGACIMHRELQKWLAGIDTSHSLIVDLHKWFSVPMAASMFITSQPEILSRTFRISTSYMPKDAGSMQITDPFAHSFQWSRRFSGLKIYLSLLIHGMRGYSEVIRRQVLVGDALRDRLVRHGWNIRNETPLPVVCFTDQAFSDQPEFARIVCQDVVKSGRAWISVYPVEKQEVLRACITNYNTGAPHIEELVTLLDAAREKYLKASFGKQ